MRASGLGTGLTIVGLALVSCGPTDGEATARSGGGEGSAPPAAGSESGAPETPAPTVDPARPRASGDDAPGGTANAGGPPAGAPTDTILLTSRGPELAFFPDRVSVRSGSFVLLRYENGGDLPHNFVLVRNEEAIDALASAAYEAAGTGYVPVDMRDDLIAFSPLVSPGESVDLEIVIPEPGEYTYICLFPGHSQMMLGTLRSLP